MKKRLLGLGLTLLAAISALGDATRVRVSLGSDYDLDSASLIYITTIGESDQVLSGPRQRRIPVKTSGLSVSITASTAGTEPFRGMVVGDEVYFNVQGVAGAGLGGTEASRVIVTKADNDNITVGVAIDLTTAQNFSWRRFVAGTAATDGWVPLAGFTQASFCWQIQQSDGGSIDVQIEGQVTGTGAPYSAPLFTKNYTTYGCSTATAGCECFTIKPQIHDRARIGFKINTDASDAGANLEKISVQFVGVAE